MLSILLVLIWKSFKQLQDSLKFTIDASSDQNKDDIVF